MKKIYTILLIFTSYFSTAQSDWSLFPTRQKTFYEFDFYNKTKITTYTADSIELQGNTSKILFNTKCPSLIYSNCCNGVADTLHPHQANSFGTFAYHLVDSLFERNDTVADDFNNLQFYFLPLATVGQSWHIINNAGVLFTDLQITCVSVQPENFLGISDSVKTFQLQGSSPSYYDTISIKLSKNFGLIQFIPFYYLYSHDVDAIQNSIVGLRNDTTSIGMSPTWQDFFLFHPGDVLLYNHTTQPFIGNALNEFYKDSITQVILTSDSLKIIYDYDNLSTNGTLFSFTNVTLNYSIAGLQSVFESPANWIAIGGFQIFNYFTIANFGVQVFFTGNYNNADSCPGIEYNLFFDKDLIDTATCNLGGVTDASFETTFRTGVGITRIYNSNFFPDDVRLIGSKINGIVCGNTDLPVGINEIGSSKLISVFPTPAHDFLEIKLNINTKASYQIFDLKGQLILGAELNTEKIDITKLTPGIYVLKIKVNEQFYFVKVVKD